MATGAGAIFGNPMNSLNTWSTGGGSSTMAPGGTFTGGSNQWMNYPSLPNFSTPGSGLAGYPFQTSPSAPGSSWKTPGGFYTQPTLDPAFTGQFYQMIQSLLGGGTGVQQDLLSFLGGGPTSIPGASQLAEMGQTGDPISALPEWQQMIAAQQRNIGENAANLKEQFAFAGDLQSSPFGTATSDFFSQTSKDQNALLAQLEQQALESAQQRKLSADTTLTGMAGAETQFLDSLFSGAATTSPGLYQKPQSSLLGGIGSLLGGAGGLLKAIPGIGSMLGIGGAAGAGAGAAGGTADLAALLGVL